MDVSPSAQPANVLEVEPRRREQVVAVVVLVCEHAPNEREAVCVHARRRKAEHEVAGSPVRTVDDAFAIDDTDARPREVELVIAVDPGQLRRLTAEQHAAGGPADLGHALDELGHLLRSITLAAT